MTSRDAAPPREVTGLAGRVRRLRRAVLGALAVSTAVSGLVLLVQVVHQAPETGSYGDGSRAVRLSHLAMLDQETGLRGFLLTGQDRFLDPYRRGRDSLPRHNAAARAAFAGEPAQLALLQDNERRQRAWTDDWATEALGGVPRGTSPATFLTRGEDLFDPYRRTEAAAERAADRLRERSEDRQVRLLVLALAVELAALLGVALVLRRPFAALRTAVAGPAGALPTTTESLPGEEPHAEEPEAAGRPVGAGLPEGTPDPAPTGRHAAPETPASHAAPALSPTAVSPTAVSPTALSRTALTRTALTPTALTRTALTRTAPGPAPPPEDRVTELPDVDPAVLHELTARLGERAAAFSATLVQTWRDETRQRVADLARAAAEQDRTAAAQVAHAVKSGSAALGALRLAHHCESLDRRLRRDEPVDLDEEAGAVRRLVDAADLAFVRTARG